MDTCKCGKYVVPQGIAGYTRNGVIEHTRQRCYEQYEANFASRVSASLRLSERR